MIRLCQTLGFLSTIVGLLVGVTPMAKAAGLNQCRGVTAEWVCDGTIPVLKVETDSPDADDIAFSVLVDGGSDTSAPVDMGGREITRVPGLSTAAPMSLGFLGTSITSPQDGPCCFFSLQIAPPAPGFCAPEGENLEQDGTDEATTANEAKTDFAVKLDLAPQCPIGAVGNQCSGEITLTHTGTPLRATIPFTLLTSDQNVTALDISGPLACSTLDAGNTFCQVPSELPQNGPMSMSINLETKPVYSPTWVEICAALNAPTDITAQIKLVQTALGVLGFYTGEPDGKVGPKTRLAVTRFATQNGIATDDPLSAGLLALLGLNAFIDANQTNNMACARTLLEPSERPVCDPLTTVAKGAECQCRYARMFEKQGGTSCQCIRGTEFKAGRGCLFPERAPTDGPGNTPDDSPRPKTCDATTTVRRGNDCVCRFQGMVQTSATTCACRSGRVPGGEGCL